MFEALIWFAVAGLGAYGVWDGFATANANAFRVTLSRRRHPGWFWAAQVLAVFACLAGLAGFLSAVAAPR